MPFKVFVAVATLVSAVLVGVLSAHVDLATKRALLVVYVGLTFVLAAVVLKLLVEPTMVRSRAPSHVAGLVIGIQAAAFTFLANGVGVHLTLGYAAHQIAWAVAGLILLAWLLVGRERPSFPPWLMALIVVLGAGSLLHATSGSLKDAALTSFAIAGMWQVAVVLARPGGVMKFLQYVAWSYWTILFVAVVAKYAHLHLGTMSGATIQLPWQGGVRNIFVTGNYTGYGAITVQGGREIGAMVAVYYVIKWRERPTMFLATAALLSALIFLTGYGRIPFTGGVLALAIAAATVPGRGLSRQVVAVVSAVILVAGLTPGLGDKVVSVATQKRVGQNSLDSGHLSLWTQHLDLFLLRPAEGVGFSFDPQDVVKAQHDPVFHPVESNDLSGADLESRGSRGEGGWTGLLAQRGILGGGIILALLFAALKYCITRYPPGEVLRRQDLTALRAILAASLFWTITDTPPMGIGQFSSFIVSQLTLIAVAQAVLVRRSSRAPVEAPRHGPSRGKVMIG